MKNLHAGKFFYVAAMVLLVVGVVYIYQLGVTGKDKVCIVVWVIFYGGLMASSAHYSHNNGSR